MPTDFTPSIGFSLGPPADPVFRAAFDRAQSEHGTADNAEAAVRYEPRLPSLLEEQDGAPSILSELLSSAVGVPLRVVAPELSFGFWRGVQHAVLFLSPEHVEGPSWAVRALFEEGRGAHELSCLLGLVLKLDWVWYSRPLGPPVPLEDAELEADDETEVAR